ncbi:hypothetical protein [Parasutterella secunda]|uniref:Holin n=1 Tax=Parasutterella secunda TaxID=626947 RepID=A0ABS2GQT0_9BURK|nr:hypothetical protein [Parasutterella secunda]MBM6928155.1 hypothetical protein [Parasutterella secunda]
MEVTPLTIYLIGLIGKIDAFLAVTTGIGIATCIALFTLYSDAVVSDEKLKLYKHFKLVLIATAVSVFSLITIPSQKTLIAMYVIPTIASSQVVKEIPDVLLDFVKSYVNEELEETIIKVNTK